MKSNDKPIITCNRNVYQRALTVNVSGGFVNIVDIFGRVFACVCGHGDYTIRV